MNPWYYFPCLLLLLFCASDAHAFDKCVNNSGKIDVVINFSKLEKIENFWFGRIIVENVGNSEKTYFVDADEDHISAYPLSIGIQIKDAGDDWSEHALTLEETAPPKAKITIFPNGKVIVFLDLNPLVAWAKSHADTKYRIWLTDVHNCKAYSQSFEM